MAQRPSKHSYHQRERVKLGWDRDAEFDLLRHFARTDFWTFFLMAWGDGNSPKGQKWIDPEIHEPLARWFQMHVEEWMRWRSEGLVQQKHLAVVVHREVGKSRMITGAGQTWLHTLDPELSTFTGSESLELSRKILNAIRGVIDGSDPFAYFTKLFGDWASNARQWSRESITHAARKQTSRADPSLGTFAVETSIVGAHPDAIFYDDPISYERLSTDTNWLAAVNSQVSSLVPVLQGDGLLVWVGCIATGSPVLMHDGTWKPIEKVCVGDRIFTTDENGESGIRTVEASIDQGVAETVVVKTKTGTIRCTPWHPFLVARGGKLAWVRADSLNKRDLVASVKRSPSQPSIPWMTTDLAWLCGIIMGDGWIGKNEHYACIAISKDESLTERILSVLEDWIPGSMFHRTPFGYVRCNSRSAAEAFRFLGLTGDAKSKRVPEWVFRCDEEHRVAFLRGFCDADGSKVVRGIDGWRVEISNAELISDLRLLARTCGVRVGMEGCARERWIKAPNSRERVRSMTASSSFNFSFVHRTERQDLKVVTKELREVNASANILGPSFRLDRVVSVERSEPTQVWDLTVEGSRSFICNGFVVHNTRYDAEDHFGVAFEKQGVASVSGMKTDSITVNPEGNIHVYFLAGRDEEGRPTTPKVWSEERLKRYQKTDPLRYASQVMNDPSISELNPITREQIDQCGVDKKDVPWHSLRFAICCDTAFSDGNKISTKDETVLLVHGYPRNGSGDVYVVEGYGNASLRAEDFGKLLVSMVQRYRRMGFKIGWITDEKTRAGKKDAWRLTLSNFFADVNEPMPAFFEFERGNTKKYERLHAASTFWVDGHVRYVKGAPGIDKLCEQMSRIGQYAVNPRIKIDWADAHSDAFNPPLYQPMRRQQQMVTPYDRGATPIATEGLSELDFMEEDGAHYRSILPREPIG